MFHMCRNVESYLGNSWLNSRVSLLIHSYIPALQSVQSVQSVSTVQSATRLLLQCTNTFISNNGSLDESASTT